MQVTGATGGSTTARALAGLVLSAAVAACGASHHAAGTLQTPTAKPPGAGPLRVPPISDAALSTGDRQHRITETIVAFYRAAWQDDPARACSLFSPAGITGFMRAAAVSFPGSVNRYSSCTHAMQIYSASLGVSVSSLQQSDPSVSGEILDNVGVANIRIHGDRATAVAPTNAVPIVGAKLISLVRTGGRWQIDGSRSSPRKGALKPKRP
jgi:hypothetical protein